ncbi:hypothetical protein SUGI_0204150 [Cryptomeria japonica]|nr:hypothetical protein SUGI_0204150 [Cryptomeria japonica]
MEAKLADFGLLRMFNIQETNVFTDVKGTLGYLDPEYAKKVIRANPIDPSKYADPRLNGEYSREAFIILLKLAVVCTASSYQGRPRVSDVYEEIEKALKLFTSIA